MYKYSGRKTAGLFTGGDAQQLKNIARPIPVWSWPGDLSKTSEGDDADETTALATEKPSIAVLPFDNMSGDSEQEFFSDG